MTFARGTREDVEEVTAIRIQAVWQLGRSGLLGRLGPLCVHGVRTSRNVNPGLINPWLILIGGCHVFVGIQTAFGGNTPQKMGRVMNPGSTLLSFTTGASPLLAMGKRPR